MTLGPLPQGDVLYSSPLAPNPRRVRLFLAELGWEGKLSVVDVDMQKGEHKSAAFLAINPNGEIPVLRLEDGLCISESMAICRFLEERELQAMAPEQRAKFRSLFGADPRSRALVEMWNRRVDISFSKWGVERIWVHNPLLSSLSKREGPKQSLEERAFGQKVCEQQLAIYDKQLAATGAFLAGADLSVADITLLCALDFAQYLGGLAFSDKQFPHVAQWRARVNERPSVKSVPNPYQGAAFAAVRGADKLISSVKRVASLPRKALGGH
jgi:glutathione S-transferase